MKLRHILTLIVVLTAALWGCSNQQVGEEQVKAMAQGKLPTSPKMVVHEWGTFTSLHDEDGNAIGGVNGGDEPLPEFSHSLSPQLLLRTWERLPPARSKGLVARCHPQITMRLETPVTYFHPPEGETSRELTVRARFTNGWFTEYYPLADVVAPGVEELQLREGTEGSLTWKVTVGGDHEGPETKEHVWLAPRAVKSASVQVGKEKERFLFYRGVGRLDAPLRVSRDDNNLKLSSQAQDVQAVPAAWLARVREDGSTAFRSLGALDLKTPRSIAADFAERDFSAQNGSKLRAEMKAAAVTDGLNPDEAEALLSTWELSYFKSQGLRLFFLVPQAWTDRVLPLEVSGENEIDRVMVARIEVVTPEQRQLMAKLEKQKHSKAWLEMPSEYRQLGRFRNALVLDQISRTPSPGLESFVKVNGLEAFKGDGGH